MKMPYGILANGITTHVHGRQEWCREVVLSDEVHGGNQTKTGGIKNVSNLNETTA
jgi:hypothetical protein